MYRVVLRMTAINAVPSPNWGSLMHGMLMEHLRGIWPALLHQDVARPLSQWVEPLSTTSLNWHVQILDDPLAVCFLESCQTGDEWFCQHNGARLIVENVSVNATSLEEYIQANMDGAMPSREMTILFKTVTTHKQQGRYVLFPSVPLMAGSLRKRLCDAYPEMEIPDKSLQLLERDTVISKYQLQSGQFGLEGTWIQGYIGQLTLRFSGLAEEIRFGHLLFGLAPWLGLGIKTTLGMGGCLTTHSQLKKDRS